jgi:hypothetical protein
MFERKAGLGHVVDMADVDDRILVGLGIRVRLVHDGENRWSRRGSPAAEDPWTLE